MWVKFGPGGAGTGGNERQRSRLFRREQKTFIGLKVVGFVAGAVWGLLPIGCVARSAAPAPARWVFTSKVGGKARPLNSKPA